MERRTLTPRIPRRALAVGLVALLAAVVVVPAIALAAGGSFVDDDTSIFEADIEWLAATGVTKGCNPPANDRFCPDDEVTRGQMAAFLRRLATNRVVDAGTLDGKDSGAFAAAGHDHDGTYLPAGAQAADADKLDGKHASAFVEHGTIVTTAGGEAWLPPEGAPPTVERYAGYVRTFGNGNMVQGITAPAWIDGVRYRLESVEICIATTPTLAGVVKVWLFRSGEFQPAVRYDNLNRETGCHVFSIEKTLESGGSLVVEVKGQEVLLQGTTFTWAPLQFGMVPVPLPGS